jgi:hypothetical protein
MLLRSNLSFCLGCQSCMFGFDVFYEPHALLALLLRYIEPLFCMVMFISVHKLLLCWVISLT